jgi:arylsulfatase A-like enzyme
LNIGGTAAGHPTTYFFPFHTKGDALPNLADGKANEYLTDRLTDEALKFIEKNRAKPFFLYLSHFAVHIPLMAKPELIAKFSETTKNGDAQTNAVYAAMIESLDDSVGRIVQKLDELKLTENTVVIFTSDNGGLAMNQGGKGIPTSNTPLRDGKGFLHEGGIRVPLIVKWPGVIRENSVCQKPVSSIDFFPTFMELAGLHTTNVVDGLSLVPLLNGNGSISERELYWHYPHYSDQGGKPGGAIRDGDFKLIEDYETGRLELYNLKEDVGEKRNIANQDAAKANELERKLDLWRRNVKAQMMMPNPDYVPLRERIQTNPRKLLK